MLHDVLLALLSTGFGVAATAWQSAREGARVRVRMLPGLLGDYGLQTGSSWDDLHAAASARGGWHAEVAVLEIENGRTPVTISEPSLDLGRQWPGRRRRRVSPAPLAAPGASTSWPLRLEGNDGAMFVYDVWSVLAPTSGGAPAPPTLPFRLRASVRVSGKRCRRRSPGWRGWRVTAGQVAFMPGEVEIGMAAYRAVFRHTRMPWMADARIIDVPVALAVRERFPRGGPAPTQAEVEQTIVDVAAPKPPLAKELLAYYVSRDLARYYEPAA